MVNFYQGEYGYYDAKAKKDRSTSRDAGGRRLPRGDSSWLYLFPAAFRAMLVWVDRRYGGTPIIITENGVDVPGGWVGGWVGGCAGGPGAGRVVGRAGGERAPSLQTCG